MIKLSIAHPGYIEALEEIIKETKENGGEEAKVYEVFMEGSSNYIGSGRAGFFSADIEDIASQTEYAHEHHLKINVLCNSSCFNGEHLNYNGWKEIFRYFNKLNEIGVDTVTVGEPYFVEMLQDFSMGITVSCVAFNDSPQKALFYEQIGADVVTIDPNINRHFDILKDIKEETSCEIKLLVNEGCLYMCPFRYAHFNLVSHVSMKKTLHGINEYYHHKCVSMRIKKPVLMITSGWIRPEDIIEYEKMGIKFFKISGRTHPVRWIINTMKAYLRRSYHGNLLNLLDVARDLRDLFYISNDDLEGAIEKWKKCSKICKKCSFCEELAQRVIKFK